MHTEKEQDTGASGPVQNRGLRGWDEAVSVPGAAGEGAGVGLTRCRLREAARAPERGADSSLGRHPLPGRGRKQQ